MWRKPTSGVSIPASTWIESPAVSATVTAAAIKITASTHGTTVCIMKRDNDRVGHMVTRVEGGPTQELGVG